MESGVDGNNGINHGRWRICSNLINRLSG